MKNAYRALKYIITSIAFLVFVAGFILAALGAYGIVLAFLHIGEESNKIGLLAIGLLQAVDLFLIAIVFFVLSIGFMLLFNEPSKPFPVSLPEWLRVKNFIELKVILWEAVLTTLVVSYLERLVENKIRGEGMDMQTTLLPAGILLVALSLYFLKKGEK